MFEFQEKPEVSPRMVQYFNKMGYEWETLGRYSEASKYYKKAFFVSQEVYGAHHKLTRCLQAKVGQMITQK